MNWRRGRVIKSLIGNDGKCRMVEVRTSTGITIRSVHNICPFPKDEAEKLEKNDLNDINNVKTNNQEPKYRRQSSRIKQKNCIATILMMLLVVPIVKTNLIFNAVNDKSGILFENQGTAGFIRSHWDLILHADMTTYWAYDAKVSKVFLELMNMTKLVNEDSILIMAANQIRAKVDRIHQNNEIIRYRQMKKTQRMPRAILGFMGSIMHSVYGLMDEEHAEALEQKIKGSQANDEYLLQMLKEQVSIQDVTKNILKNESASIWRNFDFVNTTMYSLSREMNRQLDTDLVLSALENCNMIMETFEALQRNIIELLWNSKGNFFKGLLPMEEFQQQLRCIIMNLKDDLQLPVTDPFILGQLATTSSATTNSTILFKIRLPLIQKEKMNLYHLHSYPTWHDGYFVSVNAKFRYLLINNQKTHFSTLSETQFLHCKKLADFWLCPQNGPLYSIFTDTSCEVRILLESRISSDCEIKIEPIRNYWQQLYSDTYWIYSLGNRSSIDVICEHNETTSWVEGQGSMQIKEGCTLRTKEFVYTAYEGVRSETTIFWPSMNLTFELPSLKYFEIKGELEIFKMPDIPRLKTPLSLPSNWDVDIHDLWHYGMSMINLISLVVAVIVIGLILRKLCSATRSVIPVGGFMFGR